MELAKYIDHTFLKPNGSPADIAKLCREAKKYGFASVCVHKMSIIKFLQSLSQMVEDISSLE